LIQREKSVENWFRKLIADLTARRTGLVILELSFDSEPQAASLDGIPKIPETDDLDRRLAEAWAKSGCEPDPSRREQIIRRASLLEAKRKAPQSLSPPPPFTPLAEAWAKSGCKPDPSRREQMIRRASLLEAKRKAPRPLPPPPPFTPLTCCPACGSDKYHFELGIDFHVCEKCGNRFF
jgi:hypothetical protein